MKSSKWQYMLEVKHTERNHHITMYMNWHLYIKYTHSQTVMDRLELSAAVISHQM